MSDPVPATSFSLTLNRGFGPIPAIVGCPCFGSEYADACVCDSLERFFRACASERWHPAPMTEHQRSWCFDEIRSIEGWSDYQLPVKDSVLASDVLSAWRDYARDKGLYV